jgi:hypothetical protein
MTDSNTGNNAQSSPNPPGGGPTYQDWRQQRWEWRQKMREARHSRPFHGLFPGLVLVLLGGLFLAGQQNWITADAWWQWLLIGLGAIFDHQRAGTISRAGISSFPKAPLCLGSCPDRARHCFPPWFQPLVAGCSYRRRGRHHIGRFMVKGEPGKICQRANLTCYNNVT